MSRRVPADRAAQNLQTIKSLLKLEGNKSCADCKKNKHPRWASWNLGIFICIRCSGIHRGMGTHISRVKSVDLDAWTDEQLQSVLRWGNTRANKYWEAKLAPGHIPSEAKIENFIRTKYESKRWIMDGPMPDPATLDDAGDDDVPLNVVQEKAKLERSTSLRASSVASQPVSRAAPAVDLIGDEQLRAPVRPNTTEPSITRQPPPKALPAEPKQSKPGDSLLGLDFFGPPSAPANRASSTSSTPTGSRAPSRPDLKQSILSLYASPRPQAQSQPSLAQNGGIGIAQSPPVQSPNSALGGLDDAFSGLTFSSTVTPTTQAPKPAPFADFGNYTSPRSQSTSSNGVPSSSISSGSFFTATPKSVPTMASVKQTQPSVASSALDDFGDFATASTTQSPPKAVSKSNMDDLFGLSSPMSSPNMQTPAPTSTSQTLSSAFNLSAPAPGTAKPAQKPTIQSGATGVESGWPNSDAWGSNNAWATPDPTPAPRKPSTISAPKPADLTSQEDFVWGSNTTNSAAHTASGNDFPSNQEVVKGDEDFGGWSSAPPVASTPAATSSSASKSGGGFPGADDLFSNVWQ